MARKFVILPEPFIQKCRNLAKSKDIHVEAQKMVYPFSLEAISYDGSTNKVEYIDRAEAFRLGIPDDLLLDAVSEGDRATNINGHYPVTDEIKRRLRKGWPSKLG